MNQEKQNQLIEQAEKELENHKVVRILTGDSPGEGAWQVAAPDCSNFSFTVVMGPDMAMSTGDICDLMFRGYAIRNLGYLANSPMDYLCEKLVEEFSVEVWSYELFIEAVKDAIIDNIDEWGDLKRRAILHEAENGDFDESTSRDWMDSLDENGFYVEFWTSSFSVPDGIYRDLARLKVGCRLILENTDEELK